jgi:hypothetical protein
MYPFADVEDTFARETGVLDISLVSGRGGPVNHDVVCRLMTECLQDVSFITRAMLYLFSLFLDF